MCTRADASARGPWHENTIHCMHNEIVRQNKNIKNTKKCNPAGLNLNCLYLEENQNSPRGVHYLRLRMLDIPAWDSNQSICARLTKRTAANATPALRVLANLQSQPQPQPQPQPQLQTLRYMHIWNCQRLGMQGHRQRSSGARDARDACLTAGLVRMLLIRTFASHMTRTFRPTRHRLSAWTRGTHTPAEQKGAY